MSEYIQLDQYMKIEKNGNDFIYMNWPTLNKIMISLGWVDKYLVSFSGYHYKWESIGLIYIKSTYERKSLLHFEVVDKNKFCFTVLKHCANLDGIHYHR